MTLEMAAGPAKQWESREGRYRRLFGRQLPRFRPEILSGGGRRASIMSMPNEHQDEATGDLERELDAEEGKD